MRPLILARDESHRLSIALALEAAGIPYRASPNPGVTGYIDDRRFWVDEKDYARALEAVLELDDHSPISGAQVTRRFKVFVVVGLPAIIGLWLLLWMIAGRGR